MSVCCSGSCHVYVETYRAILGYFQVFGAVRPWKNRAWPFMTSRESNEENSIELQMLSKSVWGGHKGSRKSASSCFVKVDGVLLHTPFRELKI